MSSSASALKIKHIADAWRPSKPGVTMYAAPEKQVKADGRRESTERGRDNV
ncbi:hypothetical protein [Actinoallomurus sp. CA-142502]|uniref:hypothetical protein n=1 Tax=Actinoallomurus sp. CA-142502 TaxID=3239885 RepID=UPI003D909210